MLPSANSATTPTHPLQLDHAGGAAGGPSVTANSASPAARMTAESTQIRGVRARSRPTGTGAAWSPDATVSTLLLCSPSGIGEPSTLRRGTFTERGRTTYDVALRPVRRVGDVRLRARAPGEGVVVPPAAREPPVGSRGTPGRCVNEHDRPRPDPFQSSGDCDKFVVRRGRRNPPDDGDRACHSGTFPCLRLGSSSFFVRRNASPRVSILRVSAGSMTSSM